MYKLAKSILTLLIAFSSVNVDAKITYVKQGATGLQNGSSWANAFPDLDSTLLFIPGLDTIWVTNGTYAQKFTANGIGLCDSVKVFGGFTGNETKLSQRNWQSFLTIIVARWAPSTQVRAHAVCFGNSYTHQNPTMPFDVRLDGFKITGANVYSVSDYDSNSAPIIFVGYVGSTAVLANCLVTGNHGHNGGAIGLFITPYSYSNASEFRIENCRFENNIANGYGGAIFLANSFGNGSWNTSAAFCKIKLKISDCTFKNNTATFGGAIALWDSTTEINRCTFSGNTAAFGGAIYDSLTAQLNVYNSAFLGNQAILGAAHYSAPAVSGLYKRHNFIHTTIATNVNTAVSQPSYTLTLRGTTDSLVNSILWDNINTATGASVLIPPGATVYNNLIQAPVPTGAIASYTFNPMFVSPGPTSVVPFSTLSTYNYQLNVASLAVDTAINLHLPFPYDTTINAARVIGGKPDLGAYELNYCPLAMTVTPASPYTICLPGAVTIKASPTSTSTLNYYHYWNGSTTSVDSVIVSSSGSYKVIGTTDAGCRASNTIAINAVATPKPIISISGKTLSIPAVFASYQWYKSGVLIPGATSATYQPTSNGVYSVTVTTINGGCSGSSANFNLTNLGITPVPWESSLQLYPNPTLDGRVYLDLDQRALTSPVIIEIYNLTGQRVFETTIRNTTAYTSNLLDPGSIGSGIFFVKVMMDGRSIIRKLVIE